MEPLIKELPKAQDMADLQAWVDCLLRENIELKTQVADREARLKEAEELEGMTKAMEVKQATAQKERDEAKTINRMFQTFIGNLSEVVNKAWLYEEGMDQSRASPRPKIVRCLVDYNTKMEKLLKEMQALLHSTEDQEQQSAPEPTRQPTIASVTASQPETPAATVGTVDSNLQEAILDSLNTKDIASLEQWTAGSL